MPTVPDDNAPEHANPATQPEPAKAPSLTDAEANRQLGQGEAPHAVNAPEPERSPIVGEQPAEETAPEGHQTVKVGARDVVRPSEEADGQKDGEGSLYDRLAEKDNTNAGPGGQSGAA